MRYSNAMALQRYQINVMLSKIVKTVVDKQLLQAGNKESIKVR